MTRGFDRCSFVIVNQILTPQKLSVMISFIALNLITLFSFVFSPEQLNEQRPSNEPIEQQETSIPLNDKGVRTGDLVF